MPHHAPNVLNREQLGRLLAARERRGFYNADVVDALMAETGAKWQDMKAQADQAVHDIVQGLYASRK